MSKRIPMNLSVAAAGTKRGIGKNNHLPWSLPQEFAHFVQLTKRKTDEHRINAVIMGSRNWESMRVKPMPGRLNIVLSRTMREAPMDGVLVYSSLDKAIDALHAPEWRDKIDTIWNIGGTEVYQVGVEHACFYRLYYTHIYSDSIDCDTYFPSIDWTQLVEVQDDTLPKGEQSENGLVYTYHVFERRKT